MNKTKLAIIFTGLTIGCAFFGFVLGCMFTNYSYVKILESIDIEEINIDLNETQIVDAIYKRIGFDTLTLNASASPIGEET